MKNYLLLFAAFIALNASAFDNSSVAPEFQVNSLETSTLASETDDEKNKKKKEKKEDKKEEVKSEKSSCGSQSAGAKPCCSSNKK